MCYTAKERQDNMAKQLIRSIRKGSAQWNEEDRLNIAALLVKCGYTVRISYRLCPGQSDKTNAKKEYVIEYWEEAS